MADSSVRQPEERASGFVDNWQGGKTLAECNLRMFDAEDWCDVTFRVGSSGHVIRAHRYVLISRSCVSYVMFTGDLAEKSDVSVPDTEPNDFKKFRLYLYTDSTTVDADKKAFTLIMRNGDRSLRSQGFLTLSQVLVDQIVGSDDLVVEEHVVFDAVNNWAEAECGRQGREVTPEVKLEVRGETLLKDRFPLLKHEFMAKDVKRSGLLTELDRLRILEYKGCNNNDVEPFNAKRRQYQVPHPTTHSVPRFRTENSCGWSVDENQKEAIFFWSSQDLLLCGYRLYGPKRDSAPTTYSVITYFGNEENVLQSMSRDRAHYTINSIEFEVAFEEPVTLTAGVWYTLVEIKKGRHTFRGQNRKGQLLCPDGIAFTFKNSEHSDSGTSVEDGHIPSLLYRIK